MGIVNEYGNMLKAKNYDVKIFNTKEFKNSLRYNPFKYIKCEADILTFVKTLIANTNGDGKPSSGGDAPFLPLAERGLRRKQCYIKP